MFEVLGNDLLAPDLHRLTIRAPRIAAARKAGQFVIVRSDVGQERIPLTIGDADPVAGTVTLYVQALGAATKVIVSRRPGQYLRDLAGPLGMPTEIENWGRVACLGGGVGTAVLFPMAKALADLGNEVTTIIGGRSKPYIILEKELAEFSTEVQVTTDDGSYGQAGFVTTALQNLLDDPANSPQAVFAVGPVPMMRAVSELTRNYGVKTLVSLNPIMIDGTGMCGGCRVQIGDEVKFACVDGPEFDGHLVDYDSLSDRLTMYREHEESCRLAATPLSRAS